jgi:hypothetical protein
LIDRGKAAVSAAEEMAFGGTDLDVRLDRSVAESRLAELVAGPWWRSCGPVVVVATPRAGIRSSRAAECAGGVGIRLSNEQLNVSTVAHELAHALAGIAHGHDATFRAAYVDVVAVLAGAASAVLLRDAFETMGAACSDRQWPPPHRAVGDGFVITA